MYILFQKCTNHHNKKKKHIKITYDLIVLLGDFAFEDLWVKSYAQTLLEIADTKLPKYFPDFQELCHFSKLHSLNLSLLILKITKENLLKQALSTVIQA